MGHPGISSMKSLMCIDQIWIRTLKKIVKSCIKKKKCSLSAKLPPLKFSNWPTTDTQDFMLIFAGPRNGLYYLIIVLYSHMQMHAES